MSVCVAGEGVGRDGVGEGGLWLQRRDLTSCNQLPAFLEIQQDQSSVFTHLWRTRLLSCSNACVPPPVSPWVSPSLFPFPFSVSLSALPHLPQQGPNLGTKL